MQPEGGTFFVTYRLAGSLPRNVIDKLKKERQRLILLAKKHEYLAKQWNPHIEKKLFVTWDKYLHESNNIKWLSDPNIANIVRENLYYYAGTKYTLWAYVIMPNHVHVLLTSHVSLETRPDKKNNRGTLSIILHGMRGYTAYKANRILGRTGKFWQEEAYDHLVRDNKEFQKILYYIENNPVQAGLVKSPEEWKFSSAYDRLCRGLGPFEMLDYVKVTS
ncbi:MAG: transposase [bacterium]